MLNKLLTVIGLLALISCSEPSAPEPASAHQQAEQSAVHPPAVDDTTATEQTAVASLTLWVAAEKRECMAVGPAQCLQIRFQPQEDWQLFYGEIQGFDYQPGQVYQLEVSEVLIPQPPADAPDRQWVLRQVLSTYNE